MFPYMTEGEALASLSLDQDITHQSQQVEDLNLMMLSPESSSSALDTCPQNLPLPILPFQFPAGLTCSQPHIEAGTSRLKRNPRSGPLGTVVGRPHS